jgi:APA family basic amino acid/polyamine antiporter
VSGLVRRLGLFDLTMLVMGTIIGTSIFVVPQIVARDLQSPALALGAWALGGLVALSGAFIFAELSSMRPHVGGSYVFLRDAYHPGVAFVYGWCLLLVTQTGAMASVAVIFARYFNELTGVPVREAVITTVVIAMLSFVNCLGVRTGSTVQNVLMAIKIAALAGLILAGWVFAGSHWVTQPASVHIPHPAAIFNFGGAMMPVLFAYGGWHMATFIAGEVRDPRKTLPRGLILGVSGVILLYIGVNVVCARVLGSQLASTPAPASAVMRLAFGDRGAKMIAIGIAVCALGYLSQATLTSPRVYFAMAEDQLFFKSVAWLHPRTHVPVAAILMQGSFAILIAFSHEYEQILTYVMSVDMLFIGLTAGSLLIFRRQDHRQREEAVYRVPGHPATTIVFIALNFAAALSLFYKSPVSSAIGLGIAITGIPVYFFWRFRKNRTETQLARPETLRTTLNFPFEPDSR